MPRICIREQADEPLRKILKIMPSSKGGFNIISPYLSEVTDGIVMVQQSDPRERVTTQSFDEGTWSVSSRVKAAYHGDDGRGNGLIQFSSEIKGTVISGPGRCPQIARPWWRHVGQPISTVFAWGIDGYDLAKEGDPDNLVFEAGDFAYTGCTPDAWPMAMNRSYKFAICVFSRARSKEFRFEGKRLVPWFDTRGWSYEPGKCMAFRVVDLQRSDDLFLGVGVLRATDNERDWVRSGYTMTTLHAVTGPSSQFCLAAAYPRPERDDGRSWEHLPSLDFVP